MKTYCTICGKELQKINTKYFNRQTGEKEFEMKCPDKPCEHTGHLYDDNYKKEQFKGFKSFLFKYGFIEVPDAKCTICGANGWFNIFY